MGRWGRTREYEMPRTMKTNFIDRTIKSTIVVRSRSRSCSGGDICGTTPAFRSDVNIATVAIRNSFWFNIVKNKEQAQKASGPNVADWQYLGVDKFTRWLEWNYERTGRYSSNLEDGSVKTHLHTSPIVVKISQKYSTPSMIPHFCYLKSATIVLREYCEERIHH